VAQGWQEVVHAVLNEVQQAESKGARIGTTELRRLPIWRDAKHCLVAVDELFNNGYITGMPGHGDRIENHPPHHGMDPLLEYDDLRIAPRGQAFLEGNH